MKRRFLTIKFLPFALLILASNLVLWANLDFSQGLDRLASVDKLVIRKSKRELRLFSRGAVVKSYRVALGHNPVGPKEKEGDRKTPEGLYTIDGRKEKSDFHRALHVSYPNSEDKRRGRTGGDIMIHGLPNGRGWIGKFHRLVDWTSGCIAVTNTEIEEICRVVPDGTVVEILP